MNLYNELMTKENLLPSCLDKSDQACCQESTQSTVMDPDLATEFARLLVPVTIIEELIDTIQWMSGSADFGPEGMAREGWVIAREKLDNAISYVNDFKAINVI